MSKEERAKHEQGGQSVLEGIYNSIKIDDTIKK